MPYVRSFSRQWIDGKLEELEALAHVLGPGELTYILYRLCAVYTLEHEDNYQTRNTVLGCLSATEKEYYRRQVAPYEDLKIEQNGDIFDEYRPEASDGGNTPQGTADSSEQVARPDRVRPREIRAG